MPKENYLAIRMDDETAEKLETLCEVTVRSKSDMTRFLILKEYDRMAREGELEQASEPKSNHS